MHEPRSSPYIIVPQPVLFARGGTQGGVGPLDYHDSFDLQLKYHQHPPTNPCDKKTPGQWGQIHCPHGCGELVFGYQADGVVKGKISSDRIPWGGGGNVPPAGLDTVVGSDDVLEATIPIPIP